MTDRPTAFEGSVTLVWPPPAPEGLRGCLLSLLIGEKPLRTVTALSLHADIDDYVWAELTMWVDADGHPLYGGDGEPLIGDGGVVTGTFPFLVAEMRVAEQEKNDHG